MEEPPPDMEINKIETEGKEPEEAEEMAPEVRAVEEKSPLEVELELLKDKYLRLYAEFENYKKHIVKERGEVVRQASEGLIYELLPSLDHLEIALQHTGGEAQQGLREGVEMTLRELLRTLEKFGLRQIESVGRPFDPEFHHAISLVERDDLEENTVVEELRRGYILNDRVLRASLVAVSSKPKPPAESEAGNNNETEED